MKTPLLLATVLLFISSLGICRANIGETEAQCIARYGAESEVQTDVGYRQVGDKAASFTMATPKGSLAIRVTFLNGASCHEAISSADGPGLTEDQMKAILDSQSAGLKWKKDKTAFHTAAITETYENVAWVRSDGATAHFYLSGKASNQNRSGQMDVSTKQYAVTQAFYDKENGN